MRREIGSSCVAAAVLALAGCSVQVQDETPAKFQANADVGMYPVTAKVTGGSMVSQIYVFAVSDGQRVPLSANPDGTYQTMFAVKCKSSFPLQYLAIWRLQGMATKQQLFPQQPREIELTPPPPGQPQASIDTSGKPDKKTRTWQGGPQFDFVTAPDVHITGAHLEPVSQDKADVAAAKPISVVSNFPIDAACGTPTAVQLASKAQRAHANLIIDTDLAGVPHWTVRVDFAPR
jgi:hypothetical protein